MTDRSNTEGSPIERVRGGICAYGNCRERFSGSEIPPGWRSIVMAPGSLLDTKTLLSADRDGLLCHNHTNEVLHRLRSGDGMCSRKECPLKGVDPQTALNRGWRHIVLSKESIFEPSAFLSADHDGLICHGHYREIDSLLKSLPK
jgi:hypothetical protein